MRKVQKNETGCQGKVLYWLAEKKGKDSMPTFNTSIWTFVQVYGRVLERGFINNKKTFKESQCFLQAARIAFFDLW